MGQIATGLSHIKFNNHITGLLYSRNGIDYLFDIFTSPSNATDNNPFIFIPISKVIKFCHWYCCWVLWKWKGSLGTQLGQWPLSFSQHTAAVSIMIILGFSHHSVLPQSYPLDFTSDNKVIDTLFFDYPTKSQTITFWVSCHQNHFRQNCPWHLPVPSQFKFTCLKSFIKRRWLFLLNKFCWHQTG